jgi:DNA-binding NtrC family response regulator
MGSRLRGRRIALAVADEAFRDALRRTLERQGATTSVSAAGNGILHAIETFDPSVCIIDVDLPDRRPEDLLIRIREIDPDLPVILVSAHLLPGDVPSLRELPILPLPFSRVQLLDLLDRSLDGRAA